MQRGIPIDFQDAVALRPKPHVLEFFENGLPRNAELFGGVEVPLLRLEVRGQCGRWRFSRSYFLLFLNLRF